MYHFYFFTDIQNPGSNHFEPIFGWLSKNTPQMRSNLDKILTGEALQVKASHMSRFLM